MPKNKIILKEVYEMLTAREVTSETFDALFPNIMEAEGLVLTPVEIDEIRNEYYLGICD
jgi:hypothetical protein